MEALVYFLVWGALLFVMMRFGCGAHVMGNTRHSTNSHKSEDGSLRWIAPDTDTDPVCGKTVRTENAKSSVHDGSVFYFCSRECREHFEAAPHLYVGKSSETQPKQMEDVHANK